MKVFFHEDFYQVYTSDPASEMGRMEAVVEIIKSEVDFKKPMPASEEDIGCVHTAKHIKYVRSRGLYCISALAAGGAIAAAEAGLREPCFALIRPPGHHASSGSSWGFCYFNNMSIAIEVLKKRKLINSAYVLDIDLHYGDGNVNILGNKGYVTIYNVEAHDRKSYMDRVTHEMNACQADIIGISAGFDYHMKDWGGLLATEDYFEIGKIVRAASIRCNGGCFAILEGGYNHNVLGQNVLALIQGLSAKAP